jgi:hypothetical protein
MELLWVKRGFVRGNLWAPQEVNYDSVRMARLVLNTDTVNATLDHFSDAVTKAVNFLAPPLSFALYAGAEMIFLYGLYHTFSR